jgi:hypothetical protein
VPRSRISPFTKAETRFLRELCSKGTPFLVVGMGSAVLQGVNAMTDDLDLWFDHPLDERIGEAAKIAGGSFVWRSDPPMIEGRGLDRIDLVFYCHGLRGFSSEYRKAITLEFGDFSLKLLPLERVIVSKIAAGRPKDKAVLEVLKAALKVVREKGG